MSFESVIFKCKSVLCIVLLLNISFWFGGCGAQQTLEQSISTALANAGKDGSVHIAFDRDHPVVKALAGSSFADPEGMDLFPDSQTFSFAYPDENRHFSGAYIVNDGEFIATEIVLETGGDSTTIKFDTEKRVTSIVSAGASTRCVPSVPSTS